MIYFLFIVLSCVIIYTFLSGYIITSFNIKKLTRQKCLDLGFNELPHFTIGDNLIYNLTRNRHISISGLGTPNEFVYICESDENDYKKITDIICIHNYDYDGYLTENKLKNIINILK